MKGLNGQHMHINPAAELVIIKLSSHPAGDTSLTHNLDRRAFAAIAAQYAHLSPARMSRASARDLATATTLEKNMLAPVLMLLILTTPYLLARLAERQGRPVDVNASAAWGAGLLFLFTASGHFIQTAAMVQMLPAWVPERESLVYATGLLEIAIAAALFRSRWRLEGAWAAVVVLVVFFPANIHAALQHVPYGGHAWGPIYLAVRGPLQIFIIGWIWAWILRATAHGVSAIPRDVRT